MICPYCKREIKKEDKKFMVASEKPYRNIWYHRNCWKKLKKTSKKRRHNV